MRREKKARPARELPAPDLNLSLAVGIDGWLKFVYSVSGYNHPTTQSPNQYTMKSGAMMAPGLNKHSHVPLYRQLFDKLAAQIQQGELQPGERIPSEREMAEQLHVSRTTARLAIDELVTSGLVYREQGRGTFVAEPRMRSLMGFASFSEDIIARGWQPSSQILKQEMVNVDEELQKTLKVSPKDPVLHLARLRKADGQPVALQYSYLCYRLVPGLEKQDLTNKSLFSILREQYYIYPAWTEAEIEAMAATAEEARLLEIEPGEPVLVVRGLTYTESFEIVESVKTVYRGRGLALYIGRQRFLGA